MKVRFHDLPGPSWYGINARCSESCDYLDGDGCIFEQEPLRRLANEGQLMSYKHHGFWQCMDNIREKEILEKLIAAGRAPWMKWDG